MSLYKTFMVRGGKRYSKDGRLVAAANIDPKILQILHNTDTYEDGQEEIVQTLPEKACIFCGAVSKWTKFVNLQTVYICDEHYYSESTGKIAQKVRELEHAV